MYEAGQVYERDGVRCEIQPSALDDGAVHLWFSSERRIEKVTYVSLNVVAIILRGWTRVDHIGDANKKVVFRAGQRYENGMGELIVLMVDDRGYPIVFDDNSRSGIDWWETDALMEHLETNGYVLSDPSESQAKEATNARP